jgi:formimidoylglutamate deiminase
MGATPEHLLEAVVFSSPGPAWSDVFVAGRWWLQRGRHPRQGRIQARFKAAMETLWASVRPCSQNADHPPDDSPN